MRLVAAGIALLGVASRADAAGPDAGGTAFFESHVRPILVERCYPCHSQQAGKQRGGLRLDSRAGWSKGGDSGAAITPGAPDQSLLVKAVRRLDSDLEMPPREPLPAREVEVLTRWVQMGAPDPREEVAAAPAAPARRPWAFLPLRDDSPPPVRDQTWPRGPIDRYILGAQEAHGRAPRPAAGKARLIRRATLDVTGLPPTPEEVGAFVRDPRPDAYERVVDRLLASPAYAERWARHWLDVARFAESSGFEHDYDRLYAYQYRDFVIRALQQDLPYDRFVAWQVAGDELAPDDPAALTATGFLGAGAFPTQLTEAEFEQARYDELDDMVSAVGTSFLGLTVGCARCHDHKFDPIGSRDYYRLAATFTTAIRSMVQLDLGRDSHEREVARLDEARARFKRTDGKTLPGAPIAPEPGKSPVVIVTEGLPQLPHAADDRHFRAFYPQVFVLKRGDANQKLEVATPGFLPVLVGDAAAPARWTEPPPAGARTSFRRAAMARWLTDPEKGAGQLLARVIVNRLWLQHFGRGLVATPNDFGAQGAPPTHPELLDHLARELIAGGWHLKPIHRMILLSATYRQEAADGEGDDFVGWRPRRLEAEAIRDAMLATAGVLDRRMYGPGSLDADNRRRSIYITIKRSQLTPFMQLFDAPDALSSVGQRVTTTVAPQALLFMNDPQVRGYAAAFAARLAADARRSTAAAVSRAYWLALGRAPQAAELARARAFIAAAGRRQPALVDFCQTLLALDEFVSLE
jgi:hypothetical protein